MVVNVGVWCRDVILSVSRAIDGRRAGGRERRAGRPAGDPMVMIDLCCSALLLLLLARIVCGVHVTSSGWAGWKGRA